MPFGWIQFSAATSDHVGRLRGRPKDLQAEFEKDLKRLRATLHTGLWWDRKKAVRAIVKDFDVAEPDKQLWFLERYEAEYWKLYSADEVDGARRFGDKLGNGGEEDTPSY